MIHITESYMRMMHLQIHPIYNIYQTLPRSCLRPESRVVLVSHYICFPHFHFSRVMGLIPHISSYISNLLPHVLNYGWNLPDKALSYISLPPSSHLVPRGFIIPREDHLAVGKPCPAARGPALIFIRNAFWKKEIMDKREKRWAE